MKALLILVCLGLLLVACGGDAPKTATEQVEAPIESADIRIAESAPPQYFLDVTSGLPSGCAKFDRYEVAQSANTTTVTVWNLVETPDDGACTAIYGYVDHHIPLGANFQSGTTYTVHVNDVTKTFVAQ
jgi:hypothetical protein